MSPDDPLAKDAMGTISVSVGGNPRRLLVSFAGRPTPIERSVNLPATPAEVVTAAVVLAGNLARDEASELAAEIRAKRATPPPPPPSSATPPATSTAPPVTERYEATGRLDATLKYTADETRRARLGLGWTSLGVGVGLGVATGALAPHADNAPVFTLGSLGGGFAFIGLLTLTSSDTPERLWDYRRQGHSIEDTESEWARLATLEHKHRRLGGIGLIGSGAIALGTGVVFAAVNGSNASASSYEVPLIAVGGIVTLFGAYILATDGPLESSLKAYEKASGKTLRREDAASRAGVRFSFVRGGAVGGFGGAF